VGFKTKIPKKDIKLMGIYHQDNKYQALFVNKDFKFENIELERKISNKDALMYSS
jgi:hypothetical protein